MRRRYLCQLCLALIVTILLMGAAGGARFFPELRPAVSECRLKEKEEVLVKGCVRSKTEKEGRLALELQDIVFNESLVSKERILVYLEEETLPYIPEIGSYIRISGKINVYQKPRNPGNFNQKLYYQRQNIHAYIGDAVFGGLDDMQGQSFAQCAAGRMKEWLWRVKRRAAAIVLSFMGDRRGGMLCAMLLGEKGYLEEEIKDVMSQSGIGHLYAVSGLHVSFFGYGIYRLLRRAGLPVRVCAAAGSVFLLLYVQLTGSGVSAMRAYIMFAIRMGSEVSGRVYDGLTSLAAAAIVILIGQPLMLWDAGFLLSFGAVLGIYGVLPVLRRFGERLRAGALVQGAMAAVSVNLAILPLTLWFYFEYPVFSVLWNVIAVMLAPAVMGMGLAGTLLGAASVQIGFLKNGAAAAFFGADKIAWFYEAGSRLWMTVPGSRLIAGQPSAGQVLLYYAVLLTALVLLDKRNKKSAAAWTALLIGAGLLFLPHGKRGCTEVVMLDVGQGDCFFIRGPERGAYLIDGGSSTVGRAGQYRIEPFLKSQGVGILDYAFVSHGDTDHINGIEEMLLRQKTGIKIKNLVLPAEEVWDTALHCLAVTAAHEGTRILVAGQGEVLREQGLSFTCIWPEAGYEGEAGNQASMVLSLTYRDFDMLFTGDLEKEAEACLETWMAGKQKERLLPARYEVLKAGHHGSKYATSESFLETTAPKEVFVSAGQGNSYGHPHKEVVERLANRGCTLYNTKEQGAVCLSTDGTRYRVKLPMQKRRIIVY